MDPRLLRYYDRELAFLRESGAEFGKEFPKIAARLGLDGLDCADPYVERLLEGVAFLTARVQLRIDAEFPRFTQHLLESLHPHYLAPTPSAVVVQLQPNRTEGSLVEGVVVPAGTGLRSGLGVGQQTACEYRTAMAVTLLPLEIAEARYLGSARDLAAAQLPDKATDRLGRTRQPVAALRLRLQATGPAPIGKIALDELRLFLTGTGDARFRLLEQCIARSLGVVVRPDPQQPSSDVVLGPQAITHVGLDDDEALLPGVATTFSGYRLLQEYFAIPERFLFVGIGGLAAAARRCKERTLDVHVLFDRSDAELEKIVDASMFALHCTPAVNLFRRRCDRVHVDARSEAFHLVVDRTRPMDYEVHTVLDVTGHGENAGDEFPIRPLYGIDARSRIADAYYTVAREPRMLSDRQRREGTRTRYVGHETRLALVDLRETAVHPSLKQLAVTALCTNRDLPLLMPVGSARGDFQPDSPAPIDAVRVLVGPTPPRATTAFGENAWRLVSHLVLNHRALVDVDAERGAATLREMLALYGDLADGATAKQIEGVRAVSSRPIERRLRGAGPIAFARGLEIAVTLDAAHFEGGSPFVLGAVLERFFARYVSLNSFTETVLRTVDRGEVHRFAMREGLRTSL